ncbi:MAG: SRPBCC domain-containing protein [Pseudomonadales bacterium]
MGVRHDIVRLEHSFQKPAGRVFAAWTSTEALSRWYVPGETGWWSSMEEHEFRVGGLKRLSFGPSDSVTYEEDCRYEDIVPDQRIVYSMTISAESRRLTVSLVTVEFAGVGASTTVILTDQMAILDGADTVGDRKQGWIEVFQKLGAEVAGSQR